MSFVEGGGLEVGVLALQFRRIEGPPICGVTVGIELETEARHPPAPPGSFVVVVATYSPLSDRHFCAVAKLSQAG